MPMHPHDLMLVLVKAGAATLRLVYVVRFFDTVLSAVTLKE
jgi:hypothetical protein